MAAPRPLTRCGCANGTSGSGPSAGEACSRCGGNQWFGPDGTLWFASAEGRAAMHARSRGGGRPTCGATPTGFCGSCLQFMPDDSVAQAAYDGAAEFVDTAQTELLDVAVRRALRCRGLTLAPISTTNIEAAAETLLDAIHAEACAWDDLRRTSDTGSTPQCSS